MIILEENHHSLIFIEHDPLLYEDAREMTEYVSVSLALREAAKETAVLLYAPGADPYFEELVKKLIGYSTSMKGRELRQGLLLRLMRAQRSQTTLEAFT